MRLEKKDLLLLIPATLLGIAGLGPDDPWVVGPCLILSWATFIVICAIHEGPGRTRLIIGVAITLALAGVGYRRFYSIFRERAETAKKEQPASSLQELRTEAPASEPSKAPTAKPRPKPIKNPLEIVAFRSDYGISIANNGPVPIHVINLLISSKYETKSFGLGLDIGPGKISQQLFHEEGILHKRSSRKLGATWEEHVNAARGRYSFCGMEWSYFVSADTSFRQIQQQYKNQNVELGYDNISGVLFFRFEGRSKTEEQVVPIVQTIIVNADTCPRDVIFTPHPLPSP